MPEGFSGRSTRLGSSRGWTTRTQGARATPMPANTGAGSVLPPASSNSPVWPVSHTSRPAFHAAHGWPGGSMRPVRRGHATTKTRSRWWGAPMSAASLDWSGGVNPSTWLSGVRQWHRPAFSGSPARRVQRRSSSSQTDGAVRSPPTFSAMTSDGRRMRMPSA